MVRQPVEELDSFVWSGFFLLFIQLLEIHLNCVCEIIYFGGKQLVHH